VVELSAFTRARLERIAEDALSEAGVAGVLPTPLEEVQRVAGIAARHDIGDLPGELATPGRELLGALWFERRAVYVDLAQPEPRRRFTDAHEAMHALCPWHVAALREDTDAELFRDTSLALEAEANFGAGLLIFQGRRFAARIAEGPRDMATALALAEEHGASRQATLLQFAQHHPAPVALLSIGRFPQRDGRLPLWRTVASPAFRRRFGRVGADLAPGRPLRELVEAARRFATPAAARLRLPDASGTLRHWTAEAHYNRRTFLVLVAG
jgi:IrrE N-terminal-like domain